MGWYERWEDPSKIEGRNVLDKVLEQLREDLWR